MDQLFAALGLRFSDALQLSDSCWCAWHQGSNSWRRLKLATDAQQRYGLQREAHWLKQLNDAGFTSAARLHGHYHYAGYDVLVTEYLSGETLTEQLRSTGHNDIHADFMDHMYLVLQDLHALGICHCDLKPANIVICDGRPVLLDFASAARLQSRIADLSYRSFSPSFSLPALQQGRGEADEIHDWYSLVVIANIISTATLTEPDWTDMAGSIASLTAIIQQAGLQRSAESYLVAQMQRLPLFA